MPLYYFNIFDDIVTTDDEGSELADAKAAREHAVKAARSLAADSVLHGRLNAHHHIDIVDENEDPIGTIRFDEAVELLP
jgi:hypothetical protein